MARGDKTEQATPRRRQKAREQGQIARSRELMSSLAVAAALLALGLEVPAFAGRWRSLLARVLQAAGEGGMDRPVGFFSWMAGASLPLLGAVMTLSWGVALMAAAAQGGLVFAPSALQPNLSRLSPATRMEQLFSLPSLGRLLKSLLPGTVMIYIAVVIGLREWPSWLRLARLGSAGLAAYGLGQALEIGWKCSLALILWSGADYLIERHKLSGDLRMSRQELKDEYKETEGHPTVKARIRRLRRQLARKKMLQDVERASVVITNPNEFAVALEYGPEMAAPVVVAKGRNLFARQIKEVARWRGVVLVENPPLAHALYRAAAVGQSIPPKLYAAVAAILAAIYRAQERAAGEAVSRG